MRQQRPDRPDVPEESRPWPVEGNSGEGSASALAMLQMFEDRREAARPIEPHPEEEPPSEG